ncbi:MAG: class I SAM-dependent methyltransferase, partial [Thermoprotei archaeon]
EQYVKYSYVFLELGFEIPSIVADIGCGTGLLIEFLEKHGIDRFDKYICVEPSIGMLSRVLSKRLVDHRVIVIRGYGEELPLSDQSVDAVYAFTVLGNVVDPAKFVGELLRIVRDTGYVLLSLHEKTPRKDVYEEYLEKRGFIKIGCSIDCYYLWTSNG